MSYFSYYFSTFHHFASNLVAKVKIKQFAKWERFVYKRQINRKIQFPKKGSNLYPIRMNSDVVYGSMFYYYFQIDSRMNTNPRF